MNNIHEVKKAYENILLNYKGVVSVGVGYKKVGGKMTKEISIICGVKKKLPLESLSSEEIIPKEVNGHKTDVVETGEIKALALLRTDKIRPVVRGISIGHYNITAGTLGMFVKKNGKAYGLSNNHVLANSNDGNIGDVILQQGAYDGGNIINNSTGKLYDYVPILFDREVPPPAPPTTCPIAQLYADIGNALSALLLRKSRFYAHTPVPTENKTDEAMYKSDDTISFDSYEGWGEITGTKDVVLGGAVRKSGRTTGATFGIVSQINTTVKVGYGNNRTATFVDQFIVETNDGTKFSAGGDSGSVIQMKDTSEAVGLLFAGSDTVTVCNRIENVLFGLNISV